MISVYCLTTNGRVHHLMDFLKSFEENARKGTWLFLGAQGCGPETLGYLRTRASLGTTPKAMLVQIWTENIGLNRYDELILESALRDPRGFVSPEDILVDSDDDSILPEGFEEALESVLLTDKRFGWVGFKAQDIPLLPFPHGREWQIGSYKVVEAAVGGGLAATTREIYQKIGGFGTGKTFFDPEDARFQRKCLENGYLTGMIVEKDGKPLSYEHRGSWEWKIKYGCAKQKLDNLFSAHEAGFLTLEQYRNAVQEYMEALSETK